MFENALSNLLTKMLLLFEKICGCRNK